MLVSIWQAICTSLSIIMVISELHQVGALYIVDSLAELQCRAARAHGVSRGINPANNRTFSKRFLNVRKGFLNV